MNRLLPAAGIEVPADDADRRAARRGAEAHGRGDPRARRIYETIGTCFGYAIAHYADFYDIQNMLVLGRVTSGEGGEVILAGARQVLKDEFPALADRIRLRTPGREGQAARPGDRRGEPAGRGPSRREADGRRRRGSR